VQTSSDVGALSSTGVKLEADYVLMDAAGRNYVLPARLIAASVSDWWISRPIASVLDDTLLLGSMSHLWLLHDCPRPAVCPCGHRKCMCIFACLFIRSPVQAFLANVYSYHTVACSNGQ
jgi:hypothetical protein